MGKTTSRRLYAGVDLFTHAHEQRMRSEAPLAARMRLLTLQEFALLKEILIPYEFLRRIFEANNLSSVT